MCVDRTEVTVQSYAACVVQGVCQKPDSRESGGGGACNWGVLGRELHPVNCIDKNSAETYCQQRGARLPNFNEWRWVADGGDTANSYPWGNAPPSDHACWSGVAKRSGTCPVGAFPKGDSAQGIHDLSGNVDEWTTTEFFVTPGDFLLLGGSWSDQDPNALKTIAAEHDTPDGRYETYGFRCIKVMSPPAPRPSESSEGCPENMLVVEGGKLRARGNVPVDIRTMCVDRFEVTVESYADCVKKGACQEPKTGGACNWGVSGRAWHPINCVGLDSAQAYCADKNARLPAADEWEWVAGGRNAATLYPWGNYPPSLEVWWSGRVERSSTGEVGFFVDGDSPQGISDLSGNVSEWTSTPSSEGSGSFVVRGGSWESKLPDQLRNGTTDHQARESRHHAIGFRCVKDL
ncbi:formylglycine-generating enzyme family protein [Polyangium fumosum]